MTVLREAFSHPAGDVPQPVSLETIALIEQVLAQLLGALRARITAPATRDAGAIEYDSWLRGRDR